MRGETRRDTREILAGVRSIAAYEFASCMCTLCASHDTALSARTSGSRRGRGDLGKRDARAVKSVGVYYTTSKAGVYVPTSITVHTRRFAWERVSRMRHQQHAFNTRSRHGISRPTGRRQGAREPGHRHALQ